MRTADPASCRFACALIPHLHPRSLDLSRFFLLPTCRTIQLSTALNALLDGEVQVYFGTGSASIEDIKAGRLRALAVTTATRSEALPHVPTIGESVPGFEASSVFGIGAPKNTPVEIVDTLNKRLNASLADPKAKAQLAELGGTALVGSPADFGKAIAAESEKWGKVVRAANI